MGGLFREKPEFYGENPIAKRFGMGFSQATVHALDRACTVAIVENIRLNVKKTIDSIMRTVVIYFCCGKQQNNLLA